MATFDPCSQPHLVRKSLVVVTVVVVLDTRKYNQNPPTDSICLQNLEHGKVSSLCCSPLNSYRKGGEKRTKTFL